MLRYPRQSCRPQNPRRRPHDSEHSPSTEDCPRRSRSNPESHHSSPTYHTVIKPIPQPPNSNRPPSLAPSSSPSPPNLTSSFTPPPSSHTLSLPRASRRQRHLLPLPLPPHPKRRPLRSGFRCPPPRQPKHKTSSSNPKPTKFLFRTTATKIRVVEFATRCCKRWIMLVQECECVVIRALCLRPLTVLLPV